MKIQQHKPCEQCGQEFFKRITDSQKVWETRTKYCSKDCLNKSKIGKSPTYSFPKGFKPWNKGTVGLMPDPWNKNLKGVYKLGSPSEETRMKIGLSQKGKLRPQTSSEKNGCWKGEEASLISIHKWVQKHRGTPGTCEHCGKTGLTGHSIQWANIDHKYHRDLDDYIRLCVPCHRKYDKSRGVKIGR